MARSVCTDKLFKTIIIRIQHIHLLAEKKLKSYALKTIIIIRTNK